MNLNSLVAGIVIGQLSGISEEKALEGIFAVVVLVVGMFLFRCLTRGIFALVSFVMDKREEKK